MLDWNKNSNSFAGTVHMVDDVLVCVGPEGAVGVLVALLTGGAEQPRLDIWQEQRQAAKKQHRKI